MKSKKITGPIPEFEINPEILEEGFTQSEMQLWDNCPEKWYLGYNLMLQQKGKFSWALVYGGWIHSALEEFYATKGKRWSVDAQIPNKHLLPAAILAEYDYWKQLAKLQMEIYASYYKGDFKFFNVVHNEKIADITWRGIRLKGKLDLFVWDNVHKGHYVIDHKTTGRLDKKTVMGWDFRLQFMIYCWFAKKMWPDTPVHGYFVNAMKKPQLKRGEYEMVPAFLQRVQSHMLEKPEAYFYRERLRLKKGDVKQFEEEILWPKISRIKMLLNPDLPVEIKHMLLRNKNTDHCITYGRPCEFMACCKHGLDKERHAYRKRTAKHEELTEEGVE